MKRHPVIVYWEKSGKTVSYKTIEDCAESLQTSTSHVKRLLKSGKVFVRNGDICTIDDAFTES